MNFPYFIAQKLDKQKGSSFSTFISRIAIGSVMIGIATLLISFAIFSGFRQTILDKIFSFTGHVELIKYDLNYNTYESLQPISIHDAFVQAVVSDARVASYHTFTKTPALLKTDNEVLGLILKGVGGDFQLPYFEKNLVEGRFLDTQSDTTAEGGSKEIVISKRTADKLELNLEDEVIAFFIKEPPRQRKLKVVGIYETGIEDFDDRFVYADQRLLQKLNNWEDSLVGGIQLRLHQFDNLEEDYDELDDLSGSYLYLDRVTLSYRHFFDWFKMLNQNVYIFLAIILFVACFNLVSVLLILITERTSMIGTLKALGAKDIQIQRVFFYKGLKLTIRGLLLGNLLGLGLSWIQLFFKVIPLDPENYYMHHVPIRIELLHVIFINFVVIFLISFVLFLPYIYIKRIKPIRAIRFD
ncbi:ABC transporter permease [Hugenholtzia roseola]|uniref:ABC transporter permease n=1 Tax=Hugenholtzia roseola TaxID=1002 RepID=UPI000407D936|nr:FtsX-like permease family protein [Hugenholtzia roseola]